MNATNFIQGLKDKLGSNDQVLMEHPTAWLPYALLRLGEILDRRLSEFTFNDHNIESPVPGVLENLSIVLKEEITSAVEGISSAILQKTQNVPVNDADMFGFEEKDDDDDDDEKEDKDISETEDKFDFAVLDNEDNNKKKWLIDEQITSSWNWFMRAHIKSTGLRGGDAGHGGETILKLQSRGATWSVGIIQYDENKKDHIVEIEEEPAGIVLTVQGDWELQALQNMFELASKKLKKVINNSTKKQGADK